jgi:LmbE family N-acetylglucosaminyl deacetylase
LWGAEEPDVFIDVDGFLQLKSDSLAAHASQMQRRTPRERLERIQERASHNAELVGLTYAEGFRRIRFDLGSLAWRLLYA